MSFISSKGYIHANLRASSVLLFADDRVKISGFSVSRRSYDLEACKINDGQSLRLLKERSLWRFQRLWSHPTCWRYINKSIIIIIIIIKHAIKLKTSPARLAQLLQPSLAFCFSLQPMTRRTVQDCMVRRHWLQAKKMLMRAATVLQVLQYLF